MDEMLTVAEVASQLRVHQATVRRWIAAGILPAARVGGVVRVSREALERVVEDGRIREEETHGEEGL